MRTILALLFLTFLLAEATCAHSVVVTTSVSLSNQDLKKLRRNQLNTHNNLRSKHENTPNLTQSIELDSIAQAYAQQLLASHSFSHSGAAQSGQYGENLAYIWGFPSTTLTGGQASRDWYSEKKNYSFKTGLSKNGGAIGHFTAMIWDTVTEVGFGYACGPQQSQGYNGFACYIVANYRPTPNIVGQNLQHVQKRIKAA